MGIFAILGTLLKGIIGKAAASGAVGKILGNVVKSKVTDAVVKNVVGDDKSGIASAVASNIVGGGMDKITESGALNNIIGNVTNKMGGKNVSTPQDINTPLSPRGVNVSDYDTGLKTKQPTKQEPKIGALTEKLFPGGFGGDNIGTDFVMNTIGNLSQQQLFGKGYNAPSLGEQIAQSAAGAIAPTFQQARQRQYDNKQLLQSMAMKFDPTEKMYNEFQSNIPQEINAFQQKIVDIGAGKQGLAKGSYSSEDMLNIQRDYLALQKKIDGFNGAITQARKDRAAIQEAVDKREYDMYDMEAYQRGLNYISEYGEYPPDGLLQPGAKDLDTFFSNIQIAPQNMWQEVEGQPWIKRSPVPDDSKRNYISAAMASDPGLQKGAIEYGYLDKWIQKYGQDPYVQNVFGKPGTADFDQQGFMGFAATQDYKDIVDKDKIDFAAKQKYFESQQEDKNYSIIDNYTTATGDKKRVAVFKTNKRINVPIEILRDAQGNKAQSSTGQAVSANIEYIDPTGSAIVTAVINGNTQQLRIPSEYAKSYLKTVYDPVEVDKIMRELSSGTQQQVTRAPQQETTGAALYQNKWDTYKR